MISNRSPEKKIYANDSISNTTSDKNQNIEEKLEEDKSSNNNLNEKGNILNKGIISSLNNNNDNDYNKNILIQNKLNNNNELNDLKMRNISLDGEIINEDEIINNPYREDVILSDKENKVGIDEKDNKFLTKIFGKNNENNATTKIKNNTEKVSELPVNKKTDGNYIQSKIIDEHKRLNSYSSLGSDEFKANSMDSFNPINTIRNQNNLNNEMNTHFSGQNIENKNITGFKAFELKDEYTEENNSNNINKENEDSKDEDEDDDISSVIQNPFRDDIDN